MTTTHNAEAIESSAFHSVGLLTELEELDHLRSLTNDKSIDHIVEVGVLLGNRTAFFLKCLSPSKVTLIDADPDDAPFIKNTISYNAGNDPRPDVEMNNISASSRSGKTRVGEKEVEIATIDEITRDRVDLIKIDVDGGEVDLLEGASTLFQESHAVVVIEAAPSTHDLSLHGLKSVAIRWIACLAAVVTIMCFSASKERQKIAHYSIEYICLISAINLLKVYILSRQRAFSRTMRVV